jgi:hypothetical protein
MIRKTIQVDIPSCQQAKFLRCSLAINYHLFNSRIIGPRNREISKQRLPARDKNNMLYGT